MVDYTKYDYSQLVDREEELLSNQPNWGDGYASSQGQQLIEMIADMSDQLHYMLERRTQESYLPTARLASSIRALANALTYRPRRNVSSNGTLRLTILDGNGDPTTPEGDIFIPQYTRVTFDDYEFVTEEDVTVSSSESEIDVPVVQGTYQSQTFNPLSDEYLSNSGYILFSDYEQIEENSLTVSTNSDGEFYDVRESINGEPPKHALSFTGSQETFYDLRIANNGLRLLFGDDQFGKFPTDDVSVEWVQSDGADLNIRSQNLSFSFENDTLQDDINTTPPNEYDYTLVNVTPITGGLQAETTDEIRFRAPEYHRTANRAVTKEDYNFWVLASGIGEIIDVNTYGEQERGFSDLIQLNNVWIAYLTETGNELITQDEEDLRTYLDPYKTTTTHLVFEPVDEILAQINLTLRRDLTTRGSNAVLFSHIRNQLIDYFSYERGSINKPLYYSELVRFLQRMTITIDGLEQNVADYLKLDVRALWPFTTPIETNQIDVTVQNTGSSGHNYVLTVNGTDYSYTHQSGDGTGDIASAIGTQIDSDSNNGVSATVSGSTITLTNDDETETFSITNENSDQPSDWDIEQTVELPPRIIDNRNDVDLVVPGEVEIIDDQGNVVMTDDGNGNIGPTGTIDYTTNVIRIQLLSSGTYYVRYLEDTYQNIRPNARSVVGILLPKEDYNETQETLSTINFE